VRTTGSRIGAALICALVIAALAGWSVHVQAAAGDAKYHTYQELTAALNAAAAAHPTLAKIVSIGKTREGRDLWALEIANGAGAPPDTRPALLIAANLEGDHLIGSELALATAEYLLANYPGDAAVRQRLDTSAIYIVPRMNPDGAEQMFAPVKVLRRTNATPFDADNDARVDEDGPDDLNKDGVITLMRVKDPKGPYMISPDDPRLMKRADPAKGETGGWALYTEGIDNDGDGFINEDGPGGADINRNFMHAYPYFAIDAGRYMVSEAETRALLEYVIKHRNIAAILTFGESDNLITAGRSPNSAINLIEYAERSVADARKVGMFPETAGGSGRGGRGGGGTFVFDESMLPGGRGAAPQTAGRAGGGRGMVAATMVNPADTEYLNTIATKYREITGLRAAGYTRTPAGAFFDYGYYQFGVPSFSTPGWGLPSGGGGRAGGPGGGAPPAAGTPAGMPAVGGAAGAASSGQRGAGGRGGGAGPDADAEGIDLRLLQWMDAEKVDGFVTWTAFRHPTLGDVEIGGFKPYTTVNPPAARIADLGVSHAKFAVYLSSLFSSVKVARAEAMALGGGLYRVTADVENTGYLPTSLMQGVIARSVKPIMVQLGVPPDSIVTGAEKTMSISALAGSGARQSFEWIVRAKPGTAVTLKVMSQKSGSDTATLTLK
jgi:hypothetical protein